MKKIITFVLAVTMLLSSVICISAADASPVKAYADAASGDLLYTVDFRGDSVFEPAPISDAATHFDFTPSTDGKSITIKGKETGTDKTSCFWGGTINGLVANKDTYYSMVYKVKANGKAGTNNSVGIGGWITDGNVEGLKFYNNYGNHNTVEQDDTTGSRRTALSNGSSKLGDYKIWATLKKNYEVDADGFVTMLLEFNGPKKNLTSYILADDGSIKNKSDWIKLESKSMTLNAKDDNLGVMFYAYYNVIDTTVKEVSFYKETVYEIPVTTPKQTTVATTTVATTAEATTAASTEAPSGGCNGSMAMSAIAVIPAIGCALILKKRKES